MCAPQPGLVPYVVVEEVHYSRQAPWPIGADGTGNSLQRLACLSFADDPINWQAASPTPGSINAGGFTVDSDHDGASDESELIAGTDPYNRQDLLKFDRVYSDGSHCVLEFSARAGHSYTVEKLSSFGSASSWTAVQSNLPGHDASLSVRDSLASTPSFYRLKVSRD